MNVLGNSGSTSTYFGLTGVELFTIAPAAVVPEPSTYAGLLGITCVSLLAYGWRRKRQQAA